MEDTLLEGITQENSTEETIVGSSEDAQPKETIEDIKAQKAELETAMKQLQVTISKHQGQTEALAEIHKRLDGMELSLAENKDIAQGNYEDDEAETRKPTARELVKQRQEEARKQTQETSRPLGADEFVRYAEAQGLATYDSQGKIILQGAALDAVQEGRDPKEALKFLQGKVKETQETEVNKRAEDIAQKKNEAYLKEHGLTTEGVTTPSAASEAWRGLSPGEKILAGIVQGKEK